MTAAIALDCTGIDADRFWARACPEPNTGCWLWTGSTQNGGYGATFQNGRLRRAPRVAYALAHGPVPAGMFVCHHCDTPACINPDHLFLGSPKDNTADMYAKGRATSRPGESSPVALLTDAQVIALRQAAALGERTHSLATRFGIARRTVSGILKGDRWTHLPLIPYPPGPPNGNAGKTHCLRGHEYSAANTYVNRGTRFCRACQRARRAT